MIELILEIKEAFGTFGFIAWILGVVIGLPFVVFTFLKLKSKKADE